MEYESGYPFLHTRSPSIICVSAVFPSFENPGDCKNILSKTLKIKGGNIVEEKLNSSS
jgi:hypothetical protein